MRTRFLAFVASRFPWAIRLAADAFDQAATRVGAADAPTAGFRRAFDAAAGPLAGGPSIDGPGDIPLGPSIEITLQQAHSRFIEESLGFFEREAIVASLAADERIEILRGMVLTRAVDMRLKAFFTGSDVQYAGVPFQGKGFRSLGQEAIYAAAIRLHRGAAFRGADGSWQGDIVAPIIRDLGVALAMRPEPATVRMVLSAQMAKSGPPMNGRDLHVGDLDWGILPAAAPLAISALTAMGMGLAFRHTGAPRVAVTFIGEGGSSLGEWHEAINQCAARRLPVVFCLENNQTALSTPVAEQSAVRAFADKAIGYGIPGLTIDGTDPDAIAAAFTWAADRARAAAGPTLIELVSMRMCGHAHHDDMLYLGKDPQPSWDYPPLTPQGYASQDLYEAWRRRDPIPTYAARLEAAGVLKAGDLGRFKRDAEAMVETEARAVIDADWPDAATVTAGVFADDPIDRRRLEVLARAGSEAADVPALVVEAAPPFDPKGVTFLDAVMRGVGDALEADPRVFVFGEDVGGTYGNAFLLLRPLLEKYGARLINSTLAEGAVIGGCVGAALAGLRPIGEMQFNDFVATGFNQLVNNAAKIRYRWGGSVPMVVRMPWGGLRHAGPYHSQNTEAWFYRTPGLKIVVPSTPHDARAAMAAAVADPDPVLYYEHIALYRDPRIKQAIGDARPAPLTVGKAALRRIGDDLAIISYGAYVHVALRVATRLEAEGIQASVLDLRWLAPLDRAAVLQLARRTGRVLIVHEDTRTGGIGESLAAIIQEEAFEWLDAPVRVVGALDTPVPYSPPLEHAFLPSEDDVHRAALALARY